jgi:Mn-dependent DtxR family transcriptional regulator
MLERLLAILREDGTQRVAELADKLEVTPELVLAMLESLENMGYLRRIEKECIETCTDCPIACSCAANMGEKAWILV